MMALLDRISSRSHSQTPVYHPAGRVLARSGKLERRKGVFRIDGVGLYLLKAKAVVGRQNPERIGGDTRRIGDHLPGQPGRGSQETPGQESSQNPSQERNPSERGSGQRHATRLLIHSRRVRVGAP